MCRGWLLVRWCAHCATRLANKLILGLDGDPMRLVIDGRACELYANKRRSYVRELSSKNTNTAFSLLYRWSSGECHWECHYTT